jgi:glutamine amidotransferase
VIAIIDYNMGNVASIANMLRRIGESDIVVTSEPEVVKKADKIILPGVGSFDYGVSNLHSLGITDVLLEKVTVDKTQLLAICLGMQLLTERSEEGKLPGLGKLGFVLECEDHNDVRNYGIWSRIC